MSTLSQFVGGSPIKSIQRGSTTTTGATTATISSVNTSKSVVIATHRNGRADLGLSDTTFSISASGVLTNSTTLTVQRGDGGVGVDVNPVLDWQVIEFI